MATYTDPEPASGAELISVSQPLITGNFTYLKQSYGKDHNFTSTSNTSLSNADGYHTVIHQVTQVANPATIAGVNQVYSKNYTPDTTGPVTGTQLFSRSDNGSAFQLTGINGSTEGYAWTGGLLIQWGVVSVALSEGTTGSVTFKDRAPGSIPFPTTCLNIQTTAFRGVTSPNGACTIDVRSPPLSPLNFSWRAHTNSGSYTGFYWYAIGY